MKKNTYIVPHVEITMWNSQDIITTSGETLSLDATSIANVGDGNYTVQKSYNDIIAD